MGGHALLGDVTRVQHSNVHQALHDELWLEEILALLVESLHKRRVSTGQGAQGIALLGTPALGTASPEQSDPSPAPLWSLQALHLNGDLALIFGQVGSQEPVPGQRAGDIEHSRGAVGQGPGEGQCEGARDGRVPGEVRVQRVNDGGSP